MSSKNFLKKQLTEAHGGGGVLDPTFIALVAPLSRVAARLTVGDLAAGSAATSGVRVVLRTNP